jgi:poly(A) polymerase
LKGITSMKIQIPDIAQKVFDLFPEAYLVGGSVRDMLLDTEPKDYDFASPLTPEQVMHRLHLYALPVIPIGIEFGTVATIIDERPIEITTFRCTESYTKGSRKPSVVFGTSIEEDLKRRDFTINAMAMASDGRLIDPYGGLSDLQAVQLCTPLDPKVTFQEDPLRILRAARFVSKLGFITDSQLDLAAAEARAELRSVSGERVKAEMDKILVGPNAAGALAWLAGWYILDEILPELRPLIASGRHQGSYHSKNIWEHTLSVVHQAPAEPIIRWAALLHDIGKPSTRTEKDGEVHFYRHEEVGARMFATIAPRFHFSNEDYVQIFNLISNHMVASLYDSGWSDGAIRRYVRTYGELVPKLLALSAADITSHREDRVAEHLARLDEFRTRIAAVSVEEATVPLLPSGIGNDIMARFNLKPSGEVGEIKRMLEEAILDGKLPRNAEAEVYLQYWADRRLL